MLSCHPVTLFSGWLFEASITAPTVVLFRTVLLVCTSASVDPVLSASRATVQAAKSMIVGPGLMFGTLLKLPSTNMMSVGVNLALTIDGLVTVKDMLASRFPWTVGETAGPMLTGDVVPRTVK